MKKWVDADIRCISISNTEFGETVFPDFDGGYVGEGALGGFDGTEAAAESQITDEQVAQLLELYMATDVLS